MNRDVDILAEVAMLRAEVAELRVRMTALGEEVKALRLGLEARRDRLADDTATPHGDLYH